jgi:hypothetical protein
MMARASRRGAPARRVGSLAALALLAAAALAPAAGAQEPPGPLLIDRGVAPGSTPGRPRIRLVPEPRAAMGGTNGEVTVGDPFWATVRTEGPRGYRLLPQSLIEAYAARPELAVVGSERRDGLLRLRIALFRPGDVVLPRVTASVVTDRGDTLAVPVDADTMRVASVLAPGDTVLADIKPPWAPGGIPAWVWWLAAAAAVLTAVLVWRWRRRRPAPAVALRPPRDAYREARERIAALGAEPADPEGAIAAAGGIGDALRGYLAEAWGIAARERTTFELLPSLPPAAVSERASLGGAFTVADLAKFARLAPHRGDVPPLATRAIATLDRLEDARQKAEQAAASPTTGAPSPAAALGAPSPGTPAPADGTREAAS